MHSLKRKPGFVLCQIDYICFFTGISDSKFRRSNSIIHGNCWELLHSFSNIHRFTLWCSHFKVPNTTVINIPAFFSPFCNFTQCWHWPTSDQTDLCTRPPPRPAPAGSGGALDSLLQGSAGAWWSCISAWILQVASGYSLWWGFPPDQD